MSECSVTREWEGDRLVLRLSGTFDRPAAWTLRERIERETAPEILLDFSLIRDFSDLAVAVLAHGLQASPRKVLFRGVRQHQLRIFRYCGVALEEVTARDAVAPAQPVAPAHPASAALPPHDRRV